jgi:4-hydroxybenzoate polyprenyltransferase
MNDESDVGNDVGNDEPRFGLRSGSTVRSYLELMRLPNVFTAMADVAMGFLFVQAVDWQWDPWRDSWTLALLVAASSLLYISGVVLNDVFDLEIDRQERPERPLPSGRVSLWAARWLGWKLLVLGILLGIGGVSMGVGGGLFANHPGSAAAAPLLAACILIYDAWLKRTPIGPLAMGSCRMFNVLLGMSAAGVRLPADCWLVAGGIGVYVAGVTWFARRESDTSSRLQLTLATITIALGIAMLICIPYWSERVIFEVRLDSIHWYLLTGILGLLIIWRCLWAIVEPVPERVRMAVAQGVLSIVMLDAVACYAIRGVSWAVLILLLLAPAMFLGRWIETT